MASGLLTRNKITLPIARFFSYNEFFMRTILSFSEVISRQQPLTTNAQRLVLVGGVFDLLHIGHLQFLEKAKQSGDILVVLLESDSSVKKKKGNDRPINPKRTERSYLFRFSQLTMSSYYQTQLPTKTIKT